MILPLKDAFEELCTILEQANLKVTFDPGRSFMHPCTFCGTKDEPRKLMDLGHYFNGETLTRPVCTTCEPMAKVQCTIPAG